MFREWKKREMFESTEQRVCDQARAIRKNGWLSKLELEAIKRQGEDKFQGEFCRDQDVIVDVKTVETDVETVSEEINDGEDRIGDTEEIRVKNLGRLLNN